MVGALHVLRDVDLKGGGERWLVCGPRCGQVTMIRSINRW